LLLLVALEYMTCINCQTESEGKFCPQCTQRMEVKRINFKDGWQDFWARIYGFDGMFPRTLLDLTIRPGVAARRFIEGNRVAYYGPVGYFFLMVTLLLLALGLMGMDFTDFMKGVQGTLPVQPKENELARGVQQFIADNLKLFAFLIIPFQTFAARYIFFRRSGYNLLEHSVLPFYAMGHQYWLTILSAIYLRISGKGVSPIIDIAITMLYVAFAYTGFINYQPRAKVFVKALLLFLLSQFLFIAIITALAVAWIVMIGISNPEALKSLKN
jgi:hypothetical protein